MQGQGLVVSDMSVERGGRVLLAGLTFSVPPGTALAVVGRNGVGKSTLLRAVAGLLPAATGRTTLDLAPAGGTLGERTHYLGHANGLKAGLSAAANLEFRRRWGGPPGRAPADALAAVGLSHCADIPAAFLSAGQKRRVALAGLLVSARPLWLLDEPAAALDGTSEAVLVALLQAHLAGGGIAVMALHDPLALPMATLRLGRA